MMIYFNVDVNAFLQDSNENNSRASVLLNAKEQQMASNEEDTRCRNGRRNKGGNAKKDSKGQWLSVVRICRQNGLLRRGGD